MNSEDVYVCHVDLTAWAAAPFNSTHFLSCVVCAFSSEMERCLVPASDINKNNICVQTFLECRCEFFLKRG